MAAAGTLVIRFIGDIKDFQRDLRKVQASSHGTWKSVGKFAAAGAATAGVALGVLAKKAVDLEAQFSKTMNKVAAASGTPAKGMKQLQDLAIKMGRDTVFSANEAADAMLELAKGGMKKATIQSGALAATLNLAAASDMDMATSANVAVKAMGAFNLKGKEAAQVSNALAGAANASSADVYDISIALSQAGLAAKAAGQNVQQTTAALAGFAQQGMVGSDAGTSLKTFLLNLVPTTEKASTAFRELGLRTKDGGNAFLKANGDMKSLTQMAGILDKATRKLSESERVATLKRAFGNDAFRAANALANDGAEGMRRYVKETSNQTAAQKMAEAGMKGTAGAIEQLKGSLETVILQFGIWIRPAVVAGLRMVTEGVNGIIPAIQSVASALKGGEGGGIGAAFVSAFQTVREVVAELLPVLREVGAKVLATLGPALSEVGQIISTQIIPAFQKIMPVVVPVLKFLIRLIGDALIGAIKGAVQFLKGVVGVIGGVFRLIKAIVTGEWGEAWQAVKDIAVGVWNTIIGAFKVWFNLGILALFKQGVKAILGSWKSLWGFVKGLTTKGWKAVQSLFGKATGAVEKIVLGAVKAYVKFWVGLFKKLIGVAVNGWKVLRSKFGGALAAIRTVVDNTLGALVRFFLKAMSAIGKNTWKALQWLGSRFVAGMGRIKDAILSPWQNVIKPTFEKLADLVRDFVPRAFRAGVDAIAKIWGKLKSIAAAPVRFIVNTVYMDGIRRVVNAIPGVGDLPEVRFARGGGVFGGQRGRDSVRAMLMPGEHVWTAKEVKAAGGHKVMLALRQAVLDGGLGKTFDPPFHFAKGGGLSPEAIARAHAYAKSQAGKPYIWGGVGPTGYDCSGFMSGVTNVLRGGSGFGVRYGSTGTFPWGGFKPGWGQFTIGSFRGNPGHMAGTLTGVNVESSGGVGVRYGGGARGAGDSMFNTIAHLGAGGKAAAQAGAFWDAVLAAKGFLGKIGGWFSELSSMGGWGGMMRDMAGAIVGQFKDWMVDKIPGMNTLGKIGGALGSGAKKVGGFVASLFDNGGVLRSGGFAYNGSGRPERILDPRTTANFAMLAAALDQIMRGGVGGAASGQPWTRSHEHSGHGGCPSCGGGGSRDIRIKGRLEMKDGYAYIRGIAEDAVDDALDMDDTKRRMGGDR